MRELLETFVNALLGAGRRRVWRRVRHTLERADQRPQRLHSRRPGHAGRHDRRRGAQAAGGSSFPDWLLERHQRSESALTTVVATCYLLGVSTWRMDRLVRTLGVAGLSKSQVSVMAKDLDEQVAAFRTDRWSRAHRRSWPPTP